MSHPYVLNLKTTGFSPEFPGDNVWFKDEGSKEKTIDLKVNLVSSTGERIRSDEILPFQVSLVYDGSGNDVFRAESILQILKPPSDMLRLNESGEACKHIFLSFSHPLFLLSNTLLTLRQNPNLLYP